MRIPTALAIFILPGAAAGAPWIAVLPPALEPEAAPEIVERLHEALAAGFAEGGHPSVPPAIMQALLATDADLAACREGPCVRGISEQLHVRRLVRARVIVMGKNYQMQVDLLGGGSGRVLASRTATCDICTMSEAEATLLAAATDLARNAPPWPTARTSAESPVKADAPVTMPTRPAAKPSTPGKPAPRKSWWRRWSWSEHPYAWIAVGASVVGAGAAVGGGVLVARHGDCADASSGGGCTELHNTGAVGAALIGAGVVALGGAVIATWMGSRATTSKRIFAAPTPSGGVGGAVIEF